MALSREKIKQLAHAFAGVIVLLKAYDKAEHGHLTTGILLGIIGIIMVLMSIYHHRLAQYVKSFDALVFLAEAVVLGIVSGLYFHDGKTGLPYVYALASVAYLIAAFLHFRRSKGHDHLQIDNSPNP
ncbi:hypothetical protein [Larkinella terrae]|uniref:Uncharacterized protein n=1 Tax=Larkinella terrae TaxID=2025311 RepID=A0A7K0EQ08_9BACT|nr:hypothetical protein [Larkinella terrae]MRS63498.1 hypothetical protein [Larkinella terrae]